VKIIAHKPKIDQNFAPSKVTLGGISPQAITRCQIELESCSNPLKLVKVCSLQYQKRFSLGCLVCF